MARVAWTPQAAADLGAINAYIARDSERSADLVAARIVQAVNWLMEFPQSGRVVPELGREDVRGLADCREAGCGYTIARTRLHTDCPRRTRLDAWS